MKDQPEPEGFSYYFSDDKKRCFIVANGKVNFNQCIQMMDTLVAHPDFSKQISILANLQNVNYHPTHDEFKSISGHLKSLRSELKDTRMALVCSPLMYSLGFLVCEMMNIVDFTMKTFLKMENAETWINRKIDNP